VRPISASGSRRPPGAGDPMLGSAAVTVSDRSLEAALAPVRARLADAAVFCDVDGTIAPIVPRPEDSRLLEGVPEVLLALRDRVGLLAFVSGRGLADLERLVAMPGCAYAGNHGMELHRVGREPELADGVAEHLGTVREFVAAWPAERLRAGDLRLEAKGATVSVHARGARDPEAARLMLAQIASDALDRGLVPSTGREVLELRPPVAVDKGTAVRGLLRDAGARAALYIGDDRTDADAWRALRAMRVEGAIEIALGIAVTAGEVPPVVREEADIEVPGPEGALGVLRHLIQG
jgi:trehalose 6-phosphate phosphatase